MPEYVKINDIKVGSLNVRGFGDDAILDYVTKYKLNLLGVQETHIKDSEILKDLGKDYIFYGVNTEGNYHHGVGIVAEKNLNPIFTKINSRICMCEIKLQKRKLVFISAYADTLENSRKNPTSRENFYEDLGKTIKKCSKYDIVITSADFNAQIGGGSETNPDCSGRFSRSNKTNDNGECLLNFSSAHNLFLTNTLFRHKLSHRTTWTAPYRPYKMKNGEIRTDPIRNQIDFILINKPYLRFVQNSRSYGVTTTESDHKLVIMTLKLELCRLKTEKEALKNQNKINMEGFAYPEKTLKYKENLEQLEKQSDFKNLDIKESWEKISEICK